MPFRDNSVKYMIETKKSMPPKTLRCRWFGCKPSIHTGGNLIMLDVLEAPNPKAFFNSSTYDGEGSKHIIFPGVEFMCERCGFVEFISMMKLNRLYKFADLEPWSQLINKKFTYDHEAKRCSVLLMSSKHKEVYKNNKQTVYFGKNKKEDYTKVDTKFVTWDEYKDKLIPEPKWFQKEKIFACVKIDEVTQEKTYIDLQTFKTIKSTR